MSDSEERKRLVAERHDRRRALVRSQPAPQYDSVDSLEATAHQGLADTLRPIWRRRWVIVISVLLAAGASYGALSLVPTYYVAEARLLVGVQAPRVLNVEAIIAEINPDAERVQNESFILQSRIIAQQVIDHLGLANDPSITSAGERSLSLSSLWTALAQRLAALGWVPEEWTRPSRTADPLPPDQAALEQEQRLINNVLARIDVSTLVRSHVLSIKADGPTPAAAAAIANAFANKYLDFQRAEKIKTMGRVDQILMDRITELREQVRKAEQAVENYRKGNALYKSGNSGVTTQQLSELNTTLMAALTSKIEAESRAKEAQELGAGVLHSQTVPEVLRSTTITNLKQQQADAERRVSELAASHGERHPSLRNVRAEAGAVSARLVQEIGKVVEGLVRDAKTAAARYNTLVATFENLKKQMGDVNDKSIQLEALERDAVVHRNVLEATLNRARQTFTMPDVLQANAKLISPAVGVDLPSFPPKRLLLLVGAFAGALIGTAIALTLEASDGTVRRADQIEKLTGLPVLALVPQVSRRSTSQEVLRRPFSAYSEAMRRLFVGVELTEVATSPKTLLFTSATAGEGKSMLVASLGRLLASNGKRVLVVDCDWRNPRMNKIFGCSNKAGLSDLLIGTDTLLSDCLHRDALSGLNVMTAGEWEASASHLISSDRMREVLDALAIGYDMVLLDSAPVLATADALALSRIVDKVVFVLRWGHTPREAVLEGIKQLVDLQADVAGIVLSRVIPRKFRRYSSVNRQYSNSAKATFR